MNPLDERQSLRRLATRQLLAGLLLATACLALGAFLAPTASADTTHVFLRQFSGGYGQPIPFGVDSEGNLYVYRQENYTIGKYSPEGEPINFSALGTNTINGEGGGHCPEVPSDCDATPTNGLIREQAFGNPYRSFGNMAALDTSGGPASGYIYVSNPGRNGAGGRYTAIDVFNHAGEYVGEVDQTQAEPRSCGLEDCSDRYGVYVDARGHIYIIYSGVIGTEAHENGFHIDEYVPIDGNPAHDQFVGQFEYFDPPTYAGPRSIAIGTNFIYAMNRYFVPPLYNGGDRFLWQQYPNSGFSKKGASQPLDFGLAGGPFAEFGPATGCGCSYENAVVDPNTEDVYLLNGGEAVEFNQQNEQIGPPFGAGRLGSPYTLAFDHSGGPHNGQIYAPGPVRDSLVAYSPPKVVVPDVRLESPEISRTSATVKATITSAGGPQVTGCLVEYGPQPGADYYTGEPSYQHSVPCEPAAPYSGETQVSADLTGLAANGPTHYRFVAINENGTSKVNDQLLNTVTVPDLRTESPTGITSHGATFAGSLDPAGLATQAYFEYGLDEHYGQRTPAVAVGEGSSVKSVPGAVVSQLQPGKTYHVRLVAVNELGPTSGSDVTFKTPSPPTVIGVRTANLAETSVDLIAHVDPGGAATTYQFEYGSSTSYSVSIPEPEGTLGSSSAAEDVTAQLTSLSPGVTYHFRLIAKNQWGSTASDDATFDFRPENCPNSQVRQQTNSTALPDCRAYELVSPPLAGSVKFFPGDVESHLSTLVPDYWGSPPQNAEGLAENPSRFSFYGAFGSVPGTEPPNANEDLYVATRTSTGWVTTYPGMKGSETLFVGTPHCSQTLDLCYDYRRARTETPPFGSNVPYLWHVDGTSAGRLPTNAGSIEHSDERLGDSRASANFSHFVFSSRNVAFSEGGLTKAPGSVYDNDVAAGTLTLASKLPSGGPIPLEPTDKNDAVTYLEIPMVSSDGSRILIAAPDRHICHGTPAGLSSAGVCLNEPNKALYHLYMRVGGLVTYDVSREADVRYLGATADGNRVFFLTNKRLLPEDTDTSNDIYMWEEATNSLKLVSQSGSLGSSDSCSASWTEKCGVQPIESAHPLIDRSVSAESGDIYFVSPEQLDLSDPGVPGQRNLYVYSDGGIHYITTLDPGATLTRLQVTPDGAHAAFITNSKVTAYDNAGHQEMYEYDRESGQLKCVSCNPTGAPSTSDVRGSASGLFLTDDGRAFFSTSEGLVPEDTNGLSDVYEYSGGRPQLISGAKASIDGWGGAVAQLYPPFTVGLESVSANGTDVYFSTFEPLVPQDHNGLYMKFYDARTNGGFLAKEALPPCAAADECHGATSSPPASPQVGTGAELGPDRRGSEAHRAPKKGAKGAHSGRRHGRRRRGHRRAAGRA